MYINRLLIKRTLKEKNISVLEAAEKCFPSHASPLQCFSNWINHKTASTNHESLGILCKLLEVEVGHLFVEDIN